VDKNFQSFANNSKGCRTIDLTRQPHGASSEAPAQTQILAARLPGDMVLLLGHIRRHL